MKIEIRDLAVGYSARPSVLSGVSLTVEGGEWTALVGANGSGKTTLLRAASGYLAPCAGDVLYDGRAVRSLSSRALARCRASLEQERKLELGFTVREVVAMGRIPHRQAFTRERAADRRAIAAAMEYTDTARLAGRSIHALSGGERQRVFLAMAFAQEPGVLLLDEPTAHLDLRYQTELMEIIRSRAEAGLAVLAALHDLTMAAAYADCVAVLVDGRILANGAPQDVLSESLIQRAFGVCVRVVRDQGSGSLTILPRRGRQGQG